MQQSRASADSIETFYKLTFDIGASLASSMIEPLPRGYDESIYDIVDGVADKYSPVVAGYYRNYISDVLNSVTPCTVTLGEMEVLDSKMSYREEHWLVSVDLPNVTKDVVEKLITHFGDVLQCCSIPESSLLPTALVADIYNDLGFSGDKLKEVVDVFKTVRFGPGISFYSAVSNQRVIDTVNLPDEFGAIVTKVSSF